MSAIRVESHLVGMVLRLDKDPVECIQNHSSVACVLGARFVAVTAHKLQPEFEWAKYPENLLAFRKLPAWPNGYGIRLLTGRLRVRIPPWVFFVLRGAHSSRLSAPAPPLSASFYPNGPWLAIAFF